MSQPDKLVCYLKLKTPELAGTRGRATDFHGNDIGSCVIISRWATPRSHIGSHLHQVEVTVNGVTFQGRSFGNRMAFYGKPKVGQVQGSLKLKALDLKNLDIKQIPRR